MNKTSVLLFLKIKFKMKNRLILFLFFITISSIIWAQDSLSVSKPFINSNRKYFFSASLNSCVISESPLIFINPLIEYNNSKFGFYIGPNISEKLRYDMIVIKNIQNSITISGLSFGCKYILFDSLCKNTSFILFFKSGFFKFNYSGISDFHWGGNWIDGPFNNKYTSIFSGISPGLLYKFNKRFSISFQIGPGIEYSIKKYNYVSYHSNNEKYSLILLTQLGINYKFIK